LNKATNVLDFQWFLFVICVCLYNNLLFEERIKMFQSLTLRLVFGRKMDLVFTSEGSKVKQSLCNIILCMIQFLFDRMKD